MYNNKSFKSILWANRFFFLRLLIILPIPTLKILENIKKNKNLIKIYISVYKNQRQLKLSSEQKFINFKPTSIQNVVCLITIYYFFPIYLSEIFLKQAVLCSNYFFFLTNFKINLNIICRYLLHIENYNDKKFCVR